MRVLAAAAVTDDFTRLDVLNIAADYAREVSFESRTDLRCSCSDRPVLVAQKIGKS